MPNHASKDQANHSRAGQESPLQKTGGSKATSHVVDNRPEAVQLRKLQAMEDNSPQAQNAAWMQAIMNTSSRMVVQRQHIARMFGGAAQRQKAHEGEELQMKAAAPSMQRRDIEDEKPVQGTLVTSQTPTQLQALAYTRQNLESGAHDVSAIQCVRGKKLTETQQEYDDKVAKFNYYKGKGGGYWDALVAKLAEEFPVDVNRDEAYARRYSTAVSTDVDTPTNVNSFAGKADKYVTKVQGGEAEKDPYENYMDPTSGRIVASYNYGKKDVDTDESGDTSRLPNSEILYQQYKQAVTAKDDESITISGLTEVVRSSIQNPDTMTVISLCITSLLDNFQEKTWQPGSDEFHALLGTDNCKGVAFMLKDHATSFGKKTITGIVTKGLSYIRIKLGNVQD